MAENRQLLVGLLKFLVFIITIVVLQFFVPYYWNVPSTSDTYMALCLVSWVIALFLQWIIGKALDPWAKRQNQPPPYAPVPTGRAAPAPGYQYPPQPGSPPQPTYTGQYQPYPASADNPSSPPQPTYTSQYQPYPASADNPGSPPQPTYTGQYQPTPGSTTGYYGQPVDRSDVPVGQGPVYFQQGATTNPHGVFQDHVCKRCGGPVNLDTRKCEMCGSKN